MSFGPLVEADWLHQHLHDEGLRVIDFRWYLQGKLGRDEYLKGHVPSAVFVDLDEVTGRGPGRHPLPAREQFQSAMRKAGVTSTGTVVVYDDTGASIAARLWFLLGYFGHRRQAVLNGGIQAWASPFETDVPHVDPGDFTAAAPNRSGVLDFEAVRRVEGVPVIDARLAERYRGEKEPIDPKAGHVPGALSAPYPTNLGPDHRFKPADELRAQYRALHADRGAVFYCGSGVNACHHILAMEVAGLPGAKLYEGSWSDWSNRDLPVATGPDPG